MQSLIDRLHKQLANNEPITQEQVKEWRKVYPYFSLPLMLYARQEAHNDNEALALSTIYTGDIDDWAVQLGMRADYSQLYPIEKTKSETTESAIDLFLQKYGKEEDYDMDLPFDIDTDTTQASVTQQPTSIDVLQTTIQKEPEQLIAIPAYDYLSELESMPDAEDAKPLSGGDLLDRFLQADAAGEQLFSKPEFTPTTQIHNTPQVPVEENESFFSESLAKIYIRQRRYAKALEIIRKLSLNNPEKNIYFADQIRFLEKLIINVKN